MNSTITLDSRIFDNGLKTPIPPPRKKRMSLKKGCSLPPSSSLCDEVGSSAETIDNEMQNSTQSLPSRKLKVGNKKSDKILGESLSDHLSDEPVDSPPSPASTADEIDKSISSPSMTDKKLSFLMDMLVEEQQKQANNQSNQLDKSRDDGEDDDDDDEFYKNKTPVDEPLFVARKKITRHICDDDEHIREFIHREKDPNHPSNDAPKKPERDFSKYHQHDDEIHHIEDDENAQIITTGKVRKTLSRENLPTPPEVPSQRRSTGANDLISTPIIKIDEIAVVSESTMVENIATSPDEVKKSPKLINRSTSLNLSNVHEGQSSDSEDVPQTAPILTTKAIVENFNFDPIPEKSPEKIENSVQPSVKSDTAKKVTFVEEIDTTACKSSSQVDYESAEPSTASDVSSSEQQINSSMNEIIEEIYSKNSEIMREFHSYLEPPKKHEVDTSVKIEDNDNVIKHEENVQVISVKNEPNHDVKVEQSVHSQELVEDDDEIPERRFSDSFESTDEEEPQVKIARSHKFANNTTTLVSIEIKADDNASRPVEEKKSGDDRSHSDHSTEATNTNVEKMSSESFSDLPIFKSIVDETITNTREFIREKSPDHSTLLKLLKEKEKNPSEWIVKSF